MHVILYTSILALRRQPLYLPSIHNVPIFPTRTISLMNPHIPKPIMQSTPSSLPKLHRLRDQAHSTPERRQWDLVHSRELSPEMFHALL